MSGQLRSRCKTPQSAAAAIILAKKSARFAAAPPSTTSKPLSLQREDTPYPAGTSLLRRNTPPSARKSPKPTAASTGGMPTPAPNPLSLQREGTPRPAGTSLLTRNTPPSARKSSKSKGASTGGMPTPAPKPAPGKRTATIFNLRTGSVSERDVPPTASAESKRKRQKQRSLDLDDSEDSDTDHAAARDRGNIDTDEDGGGITEEYQSEDEGIHSNAAQEAPAPIDDIDFDIQNSEAEIEQQDPVLKDGERTGENLQKMVSRNGESRCWMYFTRGYIACSGPSELPGCAMYQPIHPDWAAPLFLIENTPTLAELALTRGGNVSYAKRCAAMYHKHRRKARTQYNGTLAEALFTEKSPNCIAFNVLRGGTGPMQLSPALAHLGDTAALSELIGSGQMHTDPALFKLWRGAHASGDIYGTKKQPAAKPLDSFLSVNYDAHARLECVQRLSYQGFRHGHTPSYLADQATKFRKMRKLVRADRLEHLADAEELRMEGLPSTEAEQDAQDMLNSGALADTTEDERDE